MHPLLHDLAFHTAGVFALVFWGWELILYSCSPPAQSLLLGGLEGDSPAGRVSLNP